MTAAELQLKEQPEISPTNDVSVDLLQTFRYMTHRKLIRARNGLVKRKTRARFLWTVLLVFLLLASFGSIASRHHEMQPLNIASVVMFFLFLFGVSYLIYKVSDVIKWCLYWLAICTVIAVFILDLSAPDSTRGIAIFAVFISLEALTIGWYLIRQRVYPRVVRDAKWFDAERWWRIQRDPEDESKFSYLTMSWHTLVARQMFQYRGEIDPETRKPHGYGVWTDDSRSGELLEGYWYQGIPVGPFQSREYGTGYCFRSLRVGLVMTSGDRYDQLGFFPKWNVHGMSFSILGVECSTSGKFFKELPRGRMVGPVRHLSSFKDSKSAVNWMNQQLSVGMRHEISTEDETCIKFNPVDLTVSGYTRDASKSSETMRLMIEVDENKHVSIPGWLPATNAKKPEAFVFFHGFNCDLKTASERHAQMLSLGNFPDYIHSFIFGWPPGQILTFPLSLQFADSDELCIRFKQFVSGLILSGQYSCVHLLGHSMGARVLLNVVRTFDELFVPIAEMETYLSKDRIPLGSVTLSNGEADLGKFVSKDYDVLRTYCDLITLYVDESDGALYPDEMLTGKRMVGLHGLGSMNRQRRKRQKDLERANNHRESDVTLSRMGNSVQGSSTDLTGGDSAQNNNDDDVTENSTPEERTARWLNRLRPPIPIEHFDFDLDVIDTTLLDSNVQSLRHFYFNLNRLLVDDIHDIIVHKRRAKQRRRRLVCIEQNVYTFLSAPSYIVNP